MNLKITICPHGVDLRFAKCLMCDDPAFHAAQQPPVNVQTVTIGGHAPVLTKEQCRHLKIERYPPDSDDYQCERCLETFVVRLAAESTALTCPTCKRPFEELTAAELREYFAAEPKAPPCDLIPIVSPSAVCGLIGCKNEHVHTHDVREPLNRGGD